jgi:cathepsin A (carboxypeptidase C)
MAAAYAHINCRFFESRGSPKDDPLVLWMNGGPGCSSSTGLLFELGPCRISDEGKNTTFNEHSWINHANIVFLDQPVNTGFSYSTDGSTVNTSPDAGQDVYIFLELFLGKFPEYAKNPFHIATESYGGTYAPNIASIIHKKNKELSLTPSPHLLKINLASVMIGNGLSDPYVQMASVPDYACEGPYPVYSDPDGPECNAMRTKVPTCQRLLKACYDYNTRFACVPAGLYCNSQIIGPLQCESAELWQEISSNRNSVLGLNIYDVRMKCDRSKDGDLCYKEMGWIDTWMNNAKNKAAIGAEPSREFESCNMQVNEAFMLQGDMSHHAAALLPELIDDGIRLLVYAGNAGK